MRLNCLHYGTTLNKMERYVGKDLEGGICDLLQGTMLLFTSRLRKNTELFQS